MNRQQRRAASKWVKTQPNPAKFLKSLEELHKKLVPLKEQLDAELEKRAETVEGLKKAAE